MHVCALYRKGVLLPPKDLFSWGEGQWDAQVRTGLQLGKLRLSCPVTGLKAIKEQTNVRPGKGPRL